MLTLFPSFKNPLSPQRASVIRQVATTQSIAALVNPKRFAGALATFN
jgi:hypothetical protein